MFARLFETILEQLDILILARFAAIEKRIADGERRIAALEAKKPSGPPSVLFGTPQIRR